MERQIKCTFGEKAIVITKEEIMEILFHRGRMLLLDQVTIGGDNAVGEFTVPAGNCEGHEPIPGMLVMRGVEIIEMAFQLLGVLVAQNQELSALSKDKAVFARGSSDAKFSSAIRPGDKLTLKTKTEFNVKDVREGRIVYVESSKMVAMVGNEIKGSVHSVTIMALAADLTS